MAPATEFDVRIKGGALMIDDYGSWAGARKVVDDWIERTGQPLFLMPMDSGRVAIKPVGSWS